MPSCTATVGQLLKSFFTKKKSLCGPSRRFFWGLLVSPIFQFSKNKLTLLNWTQLPTLFFSDFFHGVFPVFSWFFLADGAKTPSGFIWPKTFNLPFPKKKFERVPLQIAGLRKFFWAPRQAWAGNEPFFQVFWVGEPGFF